MSPDGEGIEQLGRMGWDDDNESGYMVGSECGKFMGSGEKLGTKFTMSVY